MWLCSGNAVAGVVASLLPVSFFALADSRPYAQSVAGSSYEVQSLVDLAVLAFSSQLHGVHDEQPYSDHDEREDGEPEQRREQTLPGSEVDGVTHEKLWGRGRGVAPRSYVSKPDRRSLGCSPSRCEEWNRAQDSNIVHTASRLG